MFNMCQKASTAEKALKTIRRKQLDRMIWPRYVSLKIYDPLSSATSQIVQWSTEVAEVKSVPTSISVDSLSPRPIQFLNV